MQVGIIHVGILTAGSHYILQNLIEVSLKNGFPLCGIQWNQVGIHSKQLTEDTLLKWEESREMILSSLPNHLNEEHSLSLLETMNQLDSVIVLGSPSPFLKKVISQTKANVLEVPISILNDIAGSDFTLGYDTALNSIVNNILKIQDTLSSLLYSKPRVFCVQIPGESYNPLLENVALAVDGHIIFHFRNENMMKLIIEKIKTQYNQGKTFFLLIVNESVDLNEIQDYLVNQMDMDYKWNSIDESQCVGPFPTAADRILAIHLMDSIDKWIESNGDSNRLLIKGHKVVLDQ
jgi:6-phosphofructokinase 1